MAQHDFVINNQGFPAFRSDLNDFLNAVRTTHSGTSLPSGAVAGTIWLDTTSATIPLLKYYDGTDNILLATINHSTNTVTFSGVATDLVNDLTPQLGGDLDVQTNKVVSTSNLNVKVYPNGTGVFEVGGSTNSGRIQLNCEQNTHGIKLASPPHSAGQNYTLTFPSTAPSAGKVLQTDGSGNLSFESVSGGISWQSSVKTSGFTATAGEGYFCNTTSSAFTVTLPSGTPSAGQQIALVDYAGTFDTNALTINPNGNKIEGATDNLRLSGEREGVLLVYIDSTQGWLATSGINEGTDALSPTSYSIDFLVTAGGGGGGSLGGGGGAGGYRTSTQSVGIGTVITVTVGDGGAGGTTPISSTSSVGITGSNSSISGSGLTTITSAGGGGAGGHQSAPAGGVGLNGGSGGGGGSPNVSNTTGGTGNTPSTSPSQGNNGGNGFNSVPNYGAGGGGGASAVGNNGTSTAGGNGGAGTASSITGSSVTRAGGGGGGTNQGGTAGSGGSGGGGAGTVNDTTATSGTANTGGGGGGGGYAGGGGNGGAGGKGVVILSLPTANYSSTTTGSPTVTTSGSNTILQFNGSGSYTA